MDERLERLNCLICGKDEADIFMKGPKGIDVVKCRNDGLLYLNPRPKKDYLVEYFKNFVTNDNIEQFTFARKKVLKEEAGVIKQFKSGGGNLLDVGCATGVFFENFPSDKWHLFGLDTSSIGVKTAEFRYGAQVSLGTLKDARYPTQFFDVVTVLDTIFLISDPIEELMEIKRILKEDGILAIEIQGFNYRLFRDKGLLSWFLDRKWVRGFYNSMHLYFFSSSTIRLLLIKSGFSIFRMIPEQASLGRKGIWDTLNNVHFFAARLLVKISGGVFSIAGKELYLAKKESK